LPGNRRVRIAILDTGVDENNRFFRGVRLSRRSRDVPFKAVQSFVGEPKADTFGHGTNVAALILKMAPEADLIIAKISHSQEVDQASQIVEVSPWLSTRRTLSLTRLRFTQAIKWVQTFNVHIITMSFGLAEKNDAIKDAIEKAEYNGVIMFAAASNYGGNTGRAFPARLEHVLCVHASDGNGTTSGMDPSPKMGRDNFSTLGVAIPSVTENGVYLSGTSYSTPVAAGIAANILRFVQHLTDTGELAEEYRKEAFRRIGMKNILLAMSNSRDGYHYIAPWWKMWDKTSTQQRVAWMIMEALKEDMY
jgi:subtilisin family serine protease